MNLYLRKVVHPQAHDNYRVILKREGDEVEIGSIGIQHGAAWAWGIDTVIPMRADEMQREGSDRGDCMKQFKGAWERFARPNLTEFLNAKRSSAKCVRSPKSVWSNGAARNRPLPRHICHDA